MPINVVEAQMDVFEADSSSSDGLVNQWPLQETRGSTATDVRGTADATVKSDVTIDDGSFDNFPVYDFEGGSNSYLAITSKNFNSSGEISEITVGGWIRAIPPDNNRVIIGFDSSEYFRLMVQANGNVQWSTTEADGTTHHLSGSTDVGDSEWHHVVGIYDADGSPAKEIYIDGSQDASASDPHTGNNLGSGTTRYGFIGDDSEASSEDGTTDGDTFQGHMSNIFIYNRPLSSSELSSIHNTGAVAVPPDFSIPGSDVLSLDISERISSRRDTGRITLDNNSGTYNIDSNEINSGDLLRLRTRVETESVMTHQWSAMVDSVVYEQLDANRSRLRIKATDFVFGIISNRITENSFQEISVQDIINTTLNDEAGEIFQDRVQSITETVDAFPRGDNVLDFFNEMAAKADAVISSSGQSLVFEKAADARLAFQLTANDKDNHIIRKEGSSIINRARVDGGESSAIDDEQTTQSSTTTVTSSSRITHQLSTRKSEVHKIELYTSTTGSGEDVRIRLQQDDGGSPVSVSDTESDIASTTVPAEDLVNGGLTIFEMPNHSLADPDPWMIIESSGSTGQDIGVDGSNNPNYKAYFNFRIATISGAKDSQDSYRVREVRRFHGSLRTRDAAKEVSRSIIRHEKSPNEFIEFNAQSIRAHNAKVGEKITVDETNVAAEEFLIISKTAVYEGIQLQTTLEAQAVNTV